MNAGNHQVTSSENPRKWLWIAVLLGLTVIGTAGYYVLYPLCQAQKWEEELWVTTDALEAQSLISKLLRAENPHADSVLARNASSLENVVYAKEHRVVLFFDPKTGQPYSIDRWSGNNMSPNITAKFMRPEIVENLPMAVTIAVTNEVNGSRCLFIFTYKHMGHVCDLSDEEFTEWKADGFWNRYIETQGHPIAAKRKSTWNRAAEQEYQHWKRSMEEQFGGPMERIPEN